MIGDAIGSVAEIAKNVKATTKVSSKATGYAENIAQRVDTVVTKTDDGVKAIATKSNVSANVPANTSSPNAGINATGVNTKSSVKTSTFYQVTSKEDATKIITDGKLTGMEFKEVYAWSEQPTLRQAKESDARKIETAISFEVNSNIFSRDDTIAKHLRKTARVSTKPGPITIKNVKEVGFKNEWWQFWKK